MSCGQKSGRNLNLPLFTRNKSTTTSLRPFFPLEGRGREGNAFFTSLSDDIMTYIVDVNHLKKVGVKGFSQKK